METLTTSGIEVKVETSYQPGYSNPTNNEFIFAYRITLNNHNHFAVQLLRRVWIITDAGAGVRTVQGEGVVGRQPILYPADSYEYVSSCNLISAFGKMEGLYIFQNKLTGREFEVKIPVFKLAAPQILN